MVKLLEVVLGCFSNLFLAHEFKTPSDKDGIFGKIISDRLSVLIFSSLSLSDY
jgi:hypothetical protein